MTLELFLMGTLQVPTQTIESAPNSAEEIARNVSALKSRMRGRGGAAGGRGRGGKRSARSVGGDSGPGTEYAPFYIFLLQ